MTRSILAGATVAALLALSGCSSNDDDTPAAEPGPDETSMPAGEDRELSSDPGGDTGAIAGYWNASPTGPEAIADSRFVVITENGLETGYELQRDDVTGENCYSRAGPQTLTPPTEEGGEYALDDGTTFTATRSDDDATLTVVVDPQLTETWTLVEGRDPMDLPLCVSNEDDVSAGGGEDVLPDEAVDPDPGESSFNPDLGPQPPSSEPSGDDTSAIAGLWDASGGPAGGVDESFVLISSDGLYTIYDDRMDDVANGGNCYVVTERRLDLETGEAASGTYSVSGLQGFEAELIGQDGDGAGGETLRITFIDESGEGGAGGETVLWTRADAGNPVENLTVCDGS